MRKIFYIIAFLLVLPLSKTAAQQGLSLGLAGGPNFYYGSFEDDKIGFTGQLDTRYGFNEKIATTFSYSFNKFQGAKPSNYYSNTNAHNLDLHFTFDILQLSQVVDENFPLKISFDLGGGYSFYNASLHYFDSSTGSDEKLTEYYIKPEDKKSSAKIHLGGEVAYVIDNSFTVYTSILGHFYFTSAADGHSRYPSGKDENDMTVFKDAFNDMYFSTTLGLRYNLDGISLGGNSSSTRKTHNGYYQSSRNGNLFQSFRFHRYSGKKSPQNSLKSNKSKEPRSFPGGRWQGKKKDKIKVPKSSSIFRFQGKKSNGNLPK